MKLALGTVQFGVNYGVANNTGRVSEETAKEIIKLADQLGIDTLDTAAAYGNSEQVLGRNNLESFKVISKIPPSSEQTNSPSEWIETSVATSLDNLAVDSLYGILLHRPHDLLQPNGEAIYMALQKVKQQGLVDKIGVSIYSPDDLDKLENFDFDLVQAPMNIMDRRLKNSGWLEKLKKNGTEIHIRSAFLQGLLLMSSSQRPEYFNTWSDLLAEYDEWVAYSQLTPLQACIGYLNKLPEIDRVVVGVDTPEQLQEIYAALTTFSSEVPDSIQSIDQELINPARWAL